MGGGQNRADKHREWMEEGGGNEESRGELYNDREFETSSDHNTGRTQDSRPRGKHDSHTHTQYKQNFVGGAGPPEGRDSAPNTGGPPARPPAGAAVRD